MPAVLCAVPLGPGARLLTVSACVEDGLPAVIMPGSGMREQRDRVRAGIVNSGLRWPAGKITITAAPGGLPGPCSDLAVAVAVLAADGSVPAAPAGKVMFHAEVGLDGKLRPAPGVLPAVTCAAAARCRAVVVAVSDTAEASQVPGVTVIGAADLAGVAAWLRGTSSRTLPPQASPGNDAQPDMADLAGNWVARMTAEVAVTGGHHLLLTGPPGSGRALLAGRLPGIMPRLDDQQAAEVTRLHTAGGLLRPGGPVMTGPPFIAPSRTVTRAEVTGDGPAVRPGPAALAHRGVLFLDETPEFRPEVLDTLRHPLETGEILTGGGGRSTRFPARFMLVLGMSPCPCTAAGMPPDSCACDKAVIRRYLGRLSPLADHIGVRAVMTVPDTTWACRVQAPTAVVADRVREARNRAAWRLAGTPWRLNGEVPGPELLHSFPPAPGSFDPIRQEAGRGRLSEHAAAMVLRVAWTVADLCGISLPLRADCLAASAFCKGDHSWLSRYLDNSTFPVPH